jgi:hypothetical protein
MESESAGRPLGMMVACAAVQGQANYPWHQAGWCCAGTHHSRLRPKQWGKVASANL